MSFYFKKKIYERLPLSLKRISSSLLPVRIKYGREYQRIYAKGRYLDNCTRDEIIECQNRNLRKVLEFCVSYVPAYKKYEHILKKTDLIDALQHIPPVSKSDLKEHMTQYIPINLVNLPHYVVSTGGTSGDQMHFYWDKNLQNKENAYQHRLWKVLDFNIRDKRATFRGVEQLQFVNNTYWQENPIYREIRFSPFHMNDINMPKYVEKIAEYEPKFLYGYPSAIDLLAKYVIKNHLQANLPNFKGAILISEQLYQDQRERIERAFNTRAYSFYGLSERVLLGGECEVSTTYHQVPDYGTLEIIDDQGNKCLKEGDFGQLVGTGFINKSFPLIRYQTGDYAKKRDFSCRCGRQWDRFSDVEGRWELQFIIGNNGSQISLSALNIHSEIFQNVKQIQYYQREIGKCEIRLLPDDGYSNKDREAIQAAFNAKLQGSVAFHCIEVSHIDLTEIGKFQAIKSDIESL